MWQLIGAQRDAVAVCHDRTLLWNDKAGGVDSPGRSLVVQPPMLSVRE